MKHHRFSTNEILWATAWALVALSLTSLPYLLGCYLSSPDMHFGGFVIAVEDGNSYIAKMGQGARGEWLFHLPYTSEDHDGAILYPFYLLLGKVAGLSGLSLVSVYHLVRLLCGLLLLWMVYVFVSHFVPFVALRRIAFLLICFSSGLGWLLIVLKLSSDTPIDFMLPEAFTFLIIYAFPHLALAHTLMLGTFILTLTAFRRDQFLWAILAGVACFLVGLIVPFYAGGAYIVLGSYLLALLWKRRQIPWRELRLTAIVAFISAPVLLYYGYVFWTNPIFSVWAGQDLILSPHPLHYVSGYAIVALLAIGGIGYVLRRSESEELFLVSWVLVVPTLLYMPLNFQRRLAEGFQIPLCILASLGLARYVLPAVIHSGLARSLMHFQRYTQSKLRRFVTTAIILLTIPSNLLLVASSLIQVSYLSPPIFHEGIKLEAMDWLAAHTRPSDIVLSSYKVGNYIPAWAGNRVLLGHGSETIRPAEKENVVRRFFQSQTSDAYREEILRQYNITYLFYGPVERALGDFQPATSPYLQEVFANGRYAIYKVNPGH
ncbi:MAG: hypothetical protein E3J21_23175 [Anaerolineales bacterium]|nr:MAG: hypothetical protein E3J21_23175 [Anaerolineales bacterium]